MGKYINNYATTAEYVADIKPDDGSSVSEIANTEIVYDGVNVFIEEPQRGDAVVYDQNKVVKFVKAGTVTLANLTAEGYTAVGVVAKNYGNGRVLIVNKTQGDYIRWSSPFEWNVTGWVLDGNAHNVTISFNSSQVAATNNPFTYTASDIDTVVTQLNAWFDAYKATSNLQYFCYKKDASTVHVILEEASYTEWYQYSLTMSGLTVAYDTGVEVDADSDAYKISGRGGEGSVMNVERAKVYFRSDLAAGTFNPTSVQPSDGNSYPVCLPGYLGTSANVDGDKCAAMRVRWGEGEAGWINYLTNCQSLQIPAFRGCAGGHFVKDGVQIDQIDGKTLSYRLKGKKYLSKDGTEKVSYPAVETATAAGYVGVKQLEVGDWFLPSIAQLYDIIHEITYPAPDATAARADIFNRTMAAISGTAVGNGSLFWSGCRNSAYGAWIYGGNVGYAKYYGNFYSAHGVLSCLLYDLKR